MTTSFEEEHQQNLLEKIAQDEDFENPKYNIVSATNPGENFIGQVFRVKIEDASEKCLSLIFKISSPSKVRKEMVSSDVLFGTESDMYEIVLPTLNEFLKKHKLSNSSIFPGTPRCYAAALHHSSGESDCVVLEDKRFDGYNMGDVRAGVDASRCRLALQQIALMHSSYMALQELEPETADRLFKFLNKKVWESTDPMMVDFKQGYLNGLGFLGEPYTKGNVVYKKLNQIYENFDEEFNLIYEIPKDITCINHGDFWANNVLFKLNEDGPAEDACLIDFQLAAVESPVMDISLFLLICTTKEVRDQHYDELIQFYYDEVRKTLRACRCDPEKIFPWKKISEHLRLFGKNGFVGAIGSLSVLMADKSEVQGDIHSEDAETGVFSGTAKIENPETLIKLIERLNGVVQDSEMGIYLVSTT